MKSLPLDVAECEPSEKQTVNRNTLRTVWLPPREKTRLALITTQCFQQLQRACGTMVARRRTVWMFPRIGVEIFGRVYLHSTDQGHCRRSGFDSQQVLSSFLPFFVPQRIKGLYISFCWYREPRGNCVTYVALIFLPYHIQRRSSESVDTMLLGQFLIWMQDGGKLVRHTHQTHPQQNWSTIAWVRWSLSCTNQQSSNYIQETVDLRICYRIVTAILTLIYSDLTSSQFGSP